MVQTPEQTTAEQLAERVLDAALGMADLLSVHVGDRLGWYRSLVEAGPATPLELAARTSTHPRYVREWLEQQAVTGLLTVDEPVQPLTADRGDARVYAIPEATAEVMTDELSLNYLAPLARMFAAVGPQLPQLLQAYRTGGGVSWEQLGDDARLSQADMNRPWFELELGGALAALDPIDQALGSPDAVIADVGCGAGWSTIALARAYPLAQLRGFDVDEPSIALARANAETAGVSDRVRFTAGDAAELPTGHFSAAFAFECIHDMPRPVEVLAAVRRALSPSGFMVVMDENVADEFSPLGDELERLMYGFSLFICLPDGMSSQPSAATGTVMRPAVLRRYAEHAGFTTVSDLPVDDFGFWRVYRLA